LGTSLKQSFVDWPVHPKMGLFFVLSFSFRNSRVISLGRFGTKPSAKKKQQNLGGTPSILAGPGFPVPSPGPPFSHPHLCFSPSPSLFVFFCFSYFFDCLFRFSFYPGVDFFPQSRKSIGGVFGTRFPHCRVSPDGISLCGSFGSPDPIQHPKRTPTGKFIGSCISPAPLTFCPFFFSPFPAWSHG